MDFGGTQCAVSIASPRFLMIVAGNCSHLKVFRPSPRRVESPFISFASGLG